MSAPCQEYLQLNVLVGIQDKITVQETEAKLSVLYIFTNDWYIIPHEFCCGT